MYYTSNNVYPVCTNNVNIYKISRLTGSITEIYIDMGSVVTSAELTAVAGTYMVYGIAKFVVIRSAETYGKLSPKRIVCPAKSVVKF